MDSSFSRVNTINGLEHIDDAFDRGNFIEYRYSTIKREINNKPIKLMNYSVMKLTNRLEGEMIEINMYDKLTII